MNVQTRCVAAAIACLFFMACGDSSDAPLSNADVAEGADSGVAPSSAVDTKAEDVQAGNSGSEVSSKRGIIMFLQCRACHDLDVNGIHKVGPSLYGIVGSTAGSKEGFVYSDAMKNSGVTWSQETLDAFIERPAKHMPGTIMAFAGIADAEDRAALLRYLIEQSSTDK